MMLLVGTAVVDPLHDLHSLAQLWSFSHSACNAVLDRRRIAVFDAFRLVKNGPGHESIYSGFAFMLAFESIAAFFTYREFTKVSDGAPRSWNARVMLPFFTILGLIGLGIQVHAAAQYVDTCVSLLQN